MADTTKENRNLSQSWVLLEKVEDVNKLSQENDLVTTDIDSDTDGISVISESEQSHDSNSSEEDCSLLTKYEQEIIENINALPKVVETLPDNTIVDENEEELSELEDDDDEGLLFFTTGELILSSVVIIVVATAVLGVAFQIYVKNYCATTTIIKYMGCNDRDSNDRNCNELKNDNNELKASDIFAFKSITFIPLRKDDEGSLKKQEEKDCTISTFNYKSKQLHQLKKKEEYLQRKEKLLLEREQKLFKKGSSVIHSIEQCENKQKPTSFNKRTVNEYAQVNLEEEEEEEEEPVLRKLKHKKKSYKHHNKVKKEKSKENNEKKSNSDADIKYKHGKNLNKINKSSSPDTKKYKQNMTGQWYSNLYNERNNLRKRDHATDWIFERAHFRNSKRNKAYWYFQWMLNREHLRVKRNLRSFHI